MKDYNILWDDGVQTIIPGCSCILEAIGKAYLHRMGFQIVSVGVKR